MRSRSLVFALGVSLILACNTGNPAAPSVEDVKEPVPSPTPTPTEVVDAGSDSSLPVEDSSVPTPVVDSGPKAPTNQAECIHACETQYPKPAALNKEMDSACFLNGGACTSCNHLVPGGPLYPVSAPLPEVPVACEIGPGIDPIMTLNQECSDCIANTPACCKLWIDIFGSEDGRNLNKCAVKCFTDFKN